MPLGLADIIAPLSVQAFRAEHFCKRPAHLRPEAPRPVFSSARLHELLSHPTHWTPETVTLVANSLPVSPQHFCRSSHGAQRVDVQRLLELLNRGVTFVSHHVDEIAPELRAICDMLCRDLGGVSGANVYLSFQNVGGFGPHYDLSDVLAFHCEGEKVWRLYEGCVPEAVSFPPGDTAAVREHFRREAGAVAQEIRMLPGDVLYIPRGWYHDALARSAHSLHVTFSLLRN